jgi:hypothetical protein
MAGKPKIRDMAIFHASCTFVTSSHPLRHAHGDRHSVHVDENLAIQPLTRWDKPVVARFRQASPRPIFLWGCQIGESLALRLRIPFYPVTSRTETPKSVFRVFDDFPPMATITTELNEQKLNSSVIVIVECS